MKYGKDMKAEDSCASLSIHELRPNPVQVKENKMGLTRVIMGNGVIMGNVVIMESNKDFSPEIGKGIEERLPTNPEENNNRGFPKTIHL